MKRVIFVEPKIDNSEIIIDIFKKNNPDSCFVNPHICLVFPFESDLETGILESIMNDIINKYSSFNIQLRGLAISYEERNNFLFLNVIDELNILSQMSSELYKELGNNAKLRGEYVPHITIGKSKSVEEINQINEDSKILLHQTYNATVSTIYCKKIIKNLNGSIKLEDEIEIEL